MIPGFGVTLGLTLLWLCLIVLIPLASLVLKASTLGFMGFIASIATPRVLAALRLSFGLSLAAAAINAVLGLLLAWVLVRYEFPFRRILGAMVDVPFALPTAVAGIALTTIYGPQGVIGWPLSLLGIKVAFTPLG
ncbi:MAG: ABC transporter permease, partial [Parvibaculaceae bacterium]